MNILIVDDSEDQRELTEAILRSAGYKNILSVASAAEAYRLLGITGQEEGSGPIDIVLLDILMPEIDGIEACAHIRSHDRCDDMPIIMVTSLDDMDSLSNAFVAGANDYISKPVNRIELLARVRAALKLKAELERRRERERELLGFMAEWGDRRAKAWTDDITGLFTGEVIESYLSSDKRSADELVSVIALAIDRLAEVKATQGERAANLIQAKVASAVRTILAPLGAVAGSYRNGLIVIVAPDLALAGAQQLAQAACEAVSRLAIGNREMVAADYVTLSAATVSARVGSTGDRSRLLMQAIGAVHQIEAQGGNRLTA